MVKIIDAAEDTTRYLDALKGKGVETIIRYYDRFSAWKQATANEARAIARAGMKMGMVYEHVAQPSGFGMGYADGSHSRRKALDLGQPEGSAIYFAVDYDAGPEDMDGVMAYFDGVYNALTEATSLRHYRIGAYCSGYVAARLKAKYPDILIWITCSGGFRGSRAAIAAGAYDIHQTDCDTALAGLGCDFNVAKTADWGAFTPFGGIDPGPLPIPDEELGKASWYDDTRTASGEPFNPRALTAAHKTLPFQTKVLVTRRSDGSQVTVRINDRGPFVDGRIIDLTRAGAEALHMVDDGVVRVRLKVLP